MLVISNIRGGILHPEQDLQQQVSRIFSGISACLSPVSYQILRKSLDCRKHEDLHYLFRIGVTFSQSSSESKRTEEKVLRKILTKLHKPQSASLQEPVIYHFPNTVVKLPEDLRPVVVGSGPAGYFAALKLSEAGFRPIVLERGKAVEERTRDVEEFWENGLLKKDSNVSFGEGGAGTFSDGKLFTGNKDRDGVIHEILQIFRDCGADESVLYDAKPHIGTDVLRRVMQNLRQKILSAGGEIFFSSCLTGLTTMKRDPSSGLRLYDCRIQTDEGEKHLTTPAVILAIGHSARDTFQMLDQKGFRMEQKPFAVGLRIEHPQQLINEAMYGKKAAARYQGILPAADYKLVTHTADKRNVFSFCMCPGGYVVNASSDPESMVVNGMSNHARDSQNANSALVVSVTPADYPGDSPMDAVHFQQNLEKKFYQAGLFQGKSCIPVQKYADFQTGTPSQGSGIVEPEMKGACHYTEISGCLPDFVRQALLEAIPEFAKKIPGFDLPDALLSGVESRTSSPLRILRGDDRMAEGHPGIFPAGEGAGYAGGITSAAADGIRSAAAVSDYLQKNLIRTDALRRRSSLSKEIWQKESLDVCRRIMETPGYQRADLILAYRSIRQEVDLSFLVKDARKRGKKVCYPKVTGQGTMEFFLVRSEEELTEGSFHIPEPEEGESPDYSSLPRVLMILPGAAFDRDCHRIGYGGGYYDRYLKNLRNDYQEKKADSRLWALAAAFSLQIVPEVPSTASDQQPDGIITETEIIRRNQTASSEMASNMVSSGRSSSGKSSQERNR